MRAATRRLRHATPHSTMRRHRACTVVGRLARASACGEPSSARSPAGRAATASTSSEPSEPRDRGAPAGQRAGERAATAPARTQAARARRRALRDRAHELRRRHALAHRRRSARRARAGASSSGGERVDAGCRRRAGCGGCRSRRAAAQPRAHRVATSVAKVAAHARAVDQRQAQHDDAIGVPAATSASAALGVRICCARRHPAAPAGRRRETAGPAASIRR